MRFSIFTPTHDTKYLVDTYQSLLAQTYIDWEWVVVLNKGAMLPDAIIDPRVTTIRAPHWADGVGGLKRFACEQCKGYYLVELDHDDALLPEALQKISDAIDEHDPDFIYSDAVSLNEDGTCRMYGKEYGWEHYEKGSMWINSSFEPTASSLREIFYAPDHVRVWKRSVYTDVGGHDPRLPVCDDFDLIIRTYLSGAKFHHIPECLYVYRIHANGDNTWVKHNAQIQAKQAEIGNRYQPLLVDEWAKRMGLPKYDLGCGASPAEGYLGVDLSGADVNCNISAGLPFTDNSVGIIRAYDFLEHIPHCVDSRCTHEFGCTVAVMNEIYRVLVPGGWLLTATPSTDGRGAFQDPTHCSFWNSNSWWYFTREQQRRFVPGIKARFQKARIWTSFPSEWHKTHDISYVYAEVVALKGQRQPGLVEV
jgi:SAM-dependent methyltransferase